MQLSQNAFVQITEQGNPAFENMTPVSLRLNGDKLTASLLDVSYGLHSANPTLHQDLENRLAIGDLAGSLFNTDTDTRRLFFFNVMFATA